MAHFTALSVTEPLAKSECPRRAFTLFKHTTFCVAGVGNGEMLAEGSRMGNLLFSLGIGAAQKGAESKPIERRHWLASLVVGILVALLIAVGMFFLLVSQQ
jgi:hypothetical protein